MWRWRQGTPTATKEQRRVVSRLGSRAALHISHLTTRYVPSRARCSAKSAATRAAVVVSSPYLFRVWTKCPAILVSSCNGQSSIATQHLGRCLATHAMISRGRWNCAIDGVFETKGGHPCCASWLASRPGRRLARRLASRLEKSSNLNCFCFFPAKFTRKLTKKSKSSRNQRRVTNSR